MKESQFGMNTVEEILAEGGTAFSPPQQRRPKMAYELEEGNISVFVNDKGDNPKRPDYKGDIILPDGTKMRLSAWVRESANGGRKFLSGKVEPMQEQQQSAPSPQKDGDDLLF